MTGLRKVGEVAAWSIGFGFLALAVFGLALFADDCVSGVTGKPSLREVVQEPDCPCGTCSDAPGIPAEVRAFLRECEEAKTRPPEPSTGKSGTFAGGPP